VAHPKLGREVVCFCGSQARDFWRFLEWLLAKKGPVLDDRAKAKFVVLNGGIEYITLTALATTGYRVEANIHLAGDFGGRWGAKNNHFQPHTKLHRRELMARDLAAQFSAYFQPLSECAEQSNEARQCTTSNAFSSTQDTGVLLVLDRTWHLHRASLVSNRCLCAFLRL